MQCAFTLYKRKNQWTEVIESMDTEYLKTLKQAKNLTVKDLAKLTKIPEGTITNVLSGKTENPSFDTIQKLAIALDADISYIIGGQKLEELEDVSETIETIRKIYKEQIKLLNNDKIFLAIINCILVVLIAIVLLFDLFNGSIGYIRY